MLAARLRRSTLDPLRYNSFPWSANLSRLSCLYAFFSARLASFSVCLSILPASSIIAAYKHKRLSNFYAHSATSIKAGNKRTEKMLSKALIKDKKVSDINKMYTNEEFTKLMQEYYDSNKDQSN